MSKEKRKTKSYTEEFKISSAKLALESKSSQSVSQTARELGVNDNTLHTWISKYFPNRDKGEMTVSDEKDKEIKRLMKEISRLKQERDILKKAAAYFAGEMA